jgi:hypothetical protein
MSKKTSFNLFTDKTATERTKNSNPFQAKSERNVSPLPCFQATVSQIRTISGCSLLELKSIFFTIANLRLKARAKDSTHVKIYEM